MIAHEVGHILLQSGRLPPNKGPESDADAFAVNVLWKLQQFTQSDVERLYAGMVFSVRIFGALEAVGIRFAEEYPPQKERMASISEVVSQLCGSRQTFQEIARVGEAYLQMMDSVEEHMGIGNAAEALDREQLMIRLMSQILEVRLGRMGMSTLVDYLTEYLQTKPSDDMSAIIKQLKHYYVESYEQTSYFDSETKQQMGQILLTALAQLPDTIEQVSEMRRPLTR